MRSMFKAFGFLFMIVVLISISTGLFVGSGYMLSLIFSLTLFQATILCIGASFVFAFIIFAIMLDKMIFKVVHLNQKNRTFNMNHDENEESDPVVVTQSKAGRNEPCPCGSGKKYKYCCGK
jgi:hypothetical protein